MTFPTIPTTGNGRLLSQNQNNATSPRTFPSLTSLTKNAGDLLIAIVVAYERGGAGATWSSWGASFTEVADIDGGANLPSFGIATKISTGSETGTFTVAQASPVGHCSLFLLSIEGARMGGTNLEVTAVATGTGAIADPAALNPTNWDVEDTLWIAVGMNGETSTTGSWTGMGTTPALTNYSSMNSPGIGTDAVGGIHSAIAFRQNAVSSENAPAWGVSAGTHDITQARNAAILIAVRPNFDPKVGSGVLNLTGDGHVGGVKTKSGRGLLGLRAYAGTGISENKASGPDAVNFTEAGTGISANVGSGTSQKVVGGASNEKTGAGERGHVGAAVDAVVFVDSGAGVSANIAAGTDAVLFVEAGAGISPRVASGTDAVESTEAGAATSARIGAATDAVEFVESGTGILAAVGSGVAEKSAAGNTYTKSGFGQLGLGFVTAEKTGAGVRGHVGAATDSVTSAELGTGIRGHVGSGVGEKQGSKTGGAVSARIGAGDQTVIYVETSEGYEVEPPFLEGDNPPQLGHAASGVAEKSSISGSVFTKTGAGLRGHSAAATDTVTSTETGAGTSPHVGSGSDATTFVDSGAGIRGHVGSGVGSRGFEAVKTGSGTSTRVASGVDAVVYTDTASGERAHVGAALDSVTSIDAGSGIRGHTGSGEKFKLGEHVKFGTAVSARIASGTNTVEVQLPPPGTLTVTLSGRFSRTRRGNITNARRGGMLV